MPPKDKTPPGRIHTLLDRSTAAWLILAISLLLTVGLWQYSASQLAGRAQDRFAHRVEAAKSLLRARMNAHAQVLRGGAALFAASETVTRTEWRAYVDALALGHALPGIQGTGFAVMVPAAGLDAHLAAVRAEGFPDYAIHPPGERDPYTSIVYLEPFADRNLRAFGFDMYAEPVRREAMARARDTGQPALSGKVTLIQEHGSEVQPGFLIYLPIFAPGAQPATVEDRRAALIGFVYSPVRARDIMLSIFAGELREAEITLFDGPPSADTLLFASAPEAHDARLVVEHPIEIGGRTWVARFASTSAFEQDNASGEPLLLLFGGATLSLLLFALLNANARHRRRMQAAASRLAQSRDEFRTLVENVPGVVFRCQVAAPWAVIHISRNIEPLTGAAPEEFTSRRVSFGDFIVAEDVPAIEAAIQAGLRRRAGYEVEYRLRNRNGQTRWVSERGHVFLSQAGQPLWLDGVIVERHRAQAGGGGSAQSRLRQHPNPVAQPPLPARPSAPGAGQQPSPRSAWRTALHRSRPFQGGQRHLRPRGWRPAAVRSRATPAPERARG